MSENNKSSPLFVMTIFILVSISVFYFGTEYVKYQNKQNKKEYCSYYIGYSQTFLDLYDKRDESTELIDYISSNQKANPDLSLLNIYLSKKANQNIEYSDIVIDIADICFNDKINNFLPNIYKILKNGDLRKVL